MPCVARGRSRVRHAVQRVGGYPCVGATAVFPPDERPCYEWSAEIVVEGARVPAVIARELGRADVAIVDVSTRREPAMTAVTVAVE